MQIDEKIFKSYDIRGIYPDQLNEENIVPVIKSIYKLFKEQSKEDQPTVVLGYDMRLSSPTLKDKAIEALVESGAHVIDIGLSSTPTMYFTVFHYGYTAGIQITASHNPKEYNGAKMVLNSPQGLIKIGKNTGMEDIKHSALANQFESPDKEGLVTKRDTAEILSDEVNHAMSVINSKSIKPFKIVADAANAMGATYIDAMFEKVPGDLTRMNFELDGSFPSHQPDPLQEDTLKDLQQKVVEEKADLGLAPDGDGDRIFFIDDQGQIVPPSIVTALVARDLLHDYPNEKILFDIRYIFTSKMTVEEHGGIPLLTKVGHSFITEALSKEGGLFGGESSGHYFFRQTGNAEGPLLIILTILKVLSASGKKLSELAEEVKKGHQSGEINFKVENAPEILEAIKEAYKDGELSTLDGVAITYPDWRMSIRTSNTEPLLRLNVEHLDQKLLSEKTEHVRETINKHAKFAADQSSHH